MKKLLIIGLIVISILIMPMYSAVAADQELLLEDDAGDVKDLFTDDFVTRKNIDIVEASCTRDGKRVELKLKLVDGGVIQASDYIAYEFYLLTSKNEYSASYGYGEYLVYDSEDNELSGVECLGVGTRTLTFIFDLLDSDDECTFLEVAAAEITLVGDYYADFAPNDEDIPDIPDESLNVNAGGDYEGLVNESVNFSGNVSGGAPPYIWEWDFGDGNISYGQNATHVYAVAGQYIATLTVTDNDGIIGYDEATVIISVGGDDGDDGASGDGAGDGTSGGNGDSSDVGMLIFGAVIAFIVIIGIIVIIAIIRR
jgi:hypothetical protein